VVLRLAWIAVPSLILIGLWMLSRTIPDWITPNVSAAPGDVLFAASFDGGADESLNRDWDQYGGRLSTEIIDGTMRITVDDVVAGAYSAANIIFTDFILTVQGRAIAGPVDNGFGVVFRLQDQGNGSFSDDSYYLFLISSDGYYRLVRVIEGVERVVSDWIDSTAIEIGIDAVNALEVRASGDSFAFAINGNPVSLCIPTDPTGKSTYSGGGCVGGTMVETLRDSTIANGRIGVGAISTETGDAGVIVEFDNLIVIAL